MNYSLHPVPGSVSLGVGQEWNISGGYGGGC